VTLAMRPFIFLFAAFLFLGSITADEIHSSDAFKTWTLAPVSGKMPIQRSSESPSVLRPNDRLISAYDQVEDVRRLVEESFAQLSQLDFINGYGEVMRSFEPEIHHLLGLLSDKILRGHSHPWADINLQGEPDPGQINDGLDEIHVAVFEGTFDLFHIGHLIAVLRHLTDPRTRTDKVLITPNQDGEKRIIHKGDKVINWQKSAFDYRARWIKAQIQDFDPFLALYPAGRKRSTLRVMENFIRNNVDRKKIVLTHVIGPDPLYLPEMKERMAIEQTQLKSFAERFGVEFEFYLHIIERDEGPEGGYRSLLPDNIPDDHVLVSPAGDYPSKQSSLFRENGQLDIFYPNEELLTHLQPLFRFPNWGKTPITRRIEDMLLGAPMEQQIAILDQLPALLSLQAEAPELVDVIRMLAEKPEVISEIRRILASSA